MQYQQLHARISTSLYENIKSDAQHEKISINKFIEEALLNFSEKIRRKRLAANIDSYIEKTGELSSEFTNEFNTQVSKKILEECEW